MNRVAIVTSHLALGDAVSNDVLGMHGAFEKRGYEARLFAGSADFTEPKVFPVAEIKRFLQHRTDLLIYHHSIAWEPGLGLLTDAVYQTAIKYHNVTPPEFFVGVSRWHEARCREGREELKALARARCDLYLADSEYNQLDLLQAGAPAAQSAVVPPFHHIDRLHSIEPDLEVLDAYRDGQTNLLMVGRIAPHKGHAELIEAFAAYHHDYNRRSRLLIIGKEEKAFAAYSERLRELMSFLLTEESVFFTGEVTDSALKAYYLLGNVFAIASQHEGFCVPLVEAMSMKIPIVAYASSAIPGTLGGAGILFNERRPYLMAEAIDRLTRDESLSVAFGLRGWRRYERHFTNEQIEQELFAALSDLGDS
jgi:glycosyltransferase involved in cell wall biosynthesis